MTTNKMADLLRLEANALESRYKNYAAKNIMFKAAALIEQLARDGERLDWFETQHAQLSRLPTGAKLSVRNSKLHFYEGDERFYIHTPTARQAIDAAIQSTARNDGGGKQ